MKWSNVRLIFLREVRDQLRDRRTLFMVAVLPLLLYPALGIGLVNQLVSLNEQSRTVVVIGARELPAPAFIRDDRFAELTEDAFGASPKSAKRDMLRVATPENLQMWTEADRQLLEKFIATAEQQRPQLERLAWLQDQLPDEKPAVYTPEQTRWMHEERELKAKLQSLFAGGKVQVLIFFPEGFRERLTEIEARLEARQYQPGERIDVPRPLVVYNGADDKSGIAFDRVASALRAWEKELLAQRLKRLNLPTNLPRPIEPLAADLAQAQELAANMWSKVFPALLVIMSVTGAFYPAIDLGAGEKERGTMETLLISPAKRIEIVLGKFFTVMLFSLTTALLNVASMGVTGLQMVSQAGKSSPLLGDMSLPSWTALSAVVLIAIPLASLFSALSLAIAMFARSSKEGQYYLSPLLMMTLGITLFCANPTYELDPYKSVLPVVGPALLLKALLLGNLPGMALVGYSVTVLCASAFYSLCALWWAIDLFSREDVLFREAERFDLKLWVRHLLRDKEATPSRTEAVFCFVLMAVLQFIFLMRMPVLLGEHPSPTALPILQFMYLVVTVGVPPLFMALLLTSNPIETLKLRWPGWGMICVSVVLPLALLPLSLELLQSLSWFFPPMPPGMDRVMEGMANRSIPLWLSLLAFAVGPALCEELAFRGFILSGLERSRQTWVPIVVSAVLFGIIHLIPKQIFNATLLGLVLGLLAVRSRSLWPGVIFHLIYNGVQVTATRLETQHLDNPVGRLFFSFEGDAAGLRFNLPLLLISGLVSAVLIAGLLRPGGLADRLSVDPLDEEPQGHTAASAMPRV